MNHPIKSIRITNVRGIRDLSLPVDGHSLILVGENGSGKSSIIDAIEYFFTGHIAHLEGRQDVNVRDAFPYINGAGPTEIVMEWGNAENPIVVATRFPGYSPALPKAMQAYFDTANSRVFILHRDQLLNFINARDRDRYEQISDIVGLGDLDRIDVTWRAEFNTATNETREHEASFRQTCTRLAQLLESPKIRSERDIVAGLNRLLGGLGISEIQERCEIGERRIAVQQLCQSTGARERLQQLRAAKSQIEKSCDATRALLTIYKELANSIHRLLDLVATFDEADLERFLQEAVTVLEKAPDSDHCPLCEKPIEEGATGLLLRVRERLKELTELTACRQDVDRDTITLREALRTWTDNLERLAGTLEELDLVVPSQNLGIARELGSEWQEVLEGGNLPAKLSLRLDESTDLADVRTVLLALAAEIDQQIQDLVPNRIQEVAFEVLSCLEKADELWEQFQKGSANLARKNYVAAQLDLVYQALLQARIRGLKRIAAELQDNFARFYSELHPDEGCEAITLRVQEDRRASVGLQVAFHNQDAMQPLNYFSEGHLDSLGMCIFLSFIRRFNGNFRLIVLDDIWTAVDAGHRLRVARLLAKEFGDYQMIVTTHDRLWAEQLKVVLPNSRIYRLRPWNLELGACCQHVIPSDWDYYRQQIDAGRLQDAIAGVGRNLEKFFYQMRSNLSIAVPATLGDSYTIGDLYGPFFKWIEDHRPIVRRDREGFDEDVQTVREELDVVWRLRNWSGAHFNEWALQVSTREALDFLSAVEDLVERFSCPVCKALVVYNKDHEALICSNCKLTPWSHVVDQYSPEWVSASERILRSGNPQTLERIGLQLSGVLRRFLVDVSRRLPMDIEPDDEGRSLAERYAALLIWSGEHPKTGIDSWGDAIAAMKNALLIYWNDKQVQPIPDDQRRQLVNVVRDFTSLFTCTECESILSFDAEQQTYFCPKCDQKVDPAQPVSAFWPTGRR